MTASVRQVVEDAIAYRLAQISPTNGYINTLSASKVLRRPVTPAPKTDHVVMYPGREEVITGERNFGSNIWQKKLMMALIFYYSDKSTNGTRRFDWLQDIERMVGIENGMRDANGITRVDLTMLRGNLWAGMNDGQSDTYIAVSIEVFYEQRISNPAEAG